MPGGVAGGATPAPIRVPGRTGCREAWRVAPRWRPSGSRGSRCAAQQAGGLSIDLDPDDRRARPPLGRTGERRHGRPRVARVRRMEHVGQVPDERVHRRAGPQEQQPTGARDVEPIRPREAARRRQGIGLLARPPKLALDRPQQAVPLTRHDVGGERVREHQVDHAAHGSVNGDLEARRPAYVQVAEQGLEHRGLEPVPDGRGAPLKEADRDVTPQDVRSGDQGVVAQGMPPELGTGEVAGVHATRGAKSAQGDPLVLAKLPKLLADRPPGFLLPVWNIDLRCPASHGCSSVVADAHSATTAFAATYTGREAWRVAPRWRPSGCRHGPDAGRRGGWRHAGAIRVPVRAGTRRAAWRVAPRWRPSGCRYGPDAGRRGGWRHAGARPGRQSGKPQRQLHAGQCEQERGVPSPSAVRKLEPQPQPETAFGLLTVKPAPISVST